MPDTANERMASEAVAHRIDLEHYSNSVVRKIIGLLNRVDGDLFAQLAALLDCLTPSTFNIERLETLLVSTRALNAQAYAAANNALTGEIKNFVEYEAGYQFQLFQHVLPVSVSVATVNIEQTYAAAMSRPFQGKLLKEWQEKIASDRMARVRDTIRMGFVEGQTTSQIVQRIQGTRAKGFEDGVIEVDRRSARSVVQTALSHTASVVRNRFTQENADLVKARQWLSTLDNKTTPACRIRDGLLYEPETHKPIGHKVPWLAGPGQLHFCCRSTDTLVLKSYRELGIDTEEFSPAERASMDGAVPGDMPYADWIKKQSADRQDDILGPTRAKLLRNGGLELEAFYSNKGEYLTLDELRARDAAAFERAGL